MRCGLRELDCVIQNLKDCESATVIRLEGGLFVSDFEEFKSIIEEQCGRRIKDLVVNIEKLDFISSSGIGLLVEKTEMLKREGKRLWVVGPNPDIEKIFDQLALDKIVRIVASEQQATEEMKKISS